MFARKEKQDGSCRVTIKTLTDLRKSIQVGDWVRCFIEKEIVRRGHYNKIYVPVKAVVLGKYPHLLHIGLPGDKSNKIKTVTYLEVLQGMERRNYVKAIS